MIIKFVLVMLTSLEYIFKAKCPFKNCFAHKIVSAGIRSDEYWSRDPLA